MLSHAIEAKAIENSPMESSLPVCDIEGGEKGGRVSCVCMCVCAREYCVCVRVSCHCLRKGQMNIVVSSVCLNNPEKIKCEGCSRIMPFTDVCVYGVLMCLCL